ncbi:unnamed protein product [Rotaria sordida]|uniref:RING-type domain-containing protein n=1 Tax=Rotaria sordida TaxID=392033 RepID=A0A819TUG2_9BILA|nr:unnamed protein product [Rotaria sordida]CAF1507771.1 unnamed protein product [Rotaria sordida]CAF1517523.1 unnamed protein product [Rotaria sordida]CAF1660656.1 unnamed protein product [Rotaria sordida]CAF4086892.1 unnamed protein product [Rotaria sordida]
MTNNYEYMNESSIDISLKCVICSDPYVNPCSTPCDHTFCRSCIIKWIEENDRCPACRKKPITIQSLRATDRIVFDIVDRLLVRCRACRQSNIQRGNYDEHYNKYCSNTFVSCSAADLKCSWQGPRDKLQDHLTVCHYEMMRPLLGNLVNTVNTLNEKVQQYENQSKEHENRINSLESENARLKDEVNLLKGFCTKQNPNVDHNPRLEEILSRCHSYSTVMLNDLRLDNFDIPYIIRKVLIVKQCSVLNLSNNLIEVTGFELLANALRSNVTLKRLSLKGNRAQLKGVEYLATALITNSTLEVLELETNSIPDTAAYSLADMLRRNHTLKDLFLGYNDIESRGMEIMANALDHKSTLEILSLAGNKLNDKCIDALHRMININQKLQRLYLHENGLSLEGKTRLLHIVNAKKGFTLNI